MLKHSGDERYRSSPEEHSHAYQAKPLEQHAGVERQYQGVLAPFTQSAGDERTVDVCWVDGWIVQPPTVAAFCALGQRGSGMDMRDPGRKGRTLGEQQACDHPGKGLCVTNVIPHPGLHMGQDSLVESGSVPGGIFGSHKQKVSPTGDAFSYFLSGRQLSEYKTAAKIIKPKR